MKLVALAIAGALTGCTCGTLSPSEFEAQYPYGEGRLFSRGGFEPVLKDLEHQLGGPLAFNFINVRPGRASFIVRDPKRPGNVDTWSYDGGSWGKPQPVQTSRRELEDVKSFTPSDVPALLKLRELVDRALAEVKIERGRVENVSVSRTDKTIELRLDISGPREKGHVRFDAAGALLVKHVD